MEKEGRGGAGDSKRQMDHVHFNQKTPNTDLPAYIIHHIDIDSAVYEKRKGGLPAGRGMESMRLKKWYIQQTSNADPREEHSSKHIDIPPAWFILLHY